MTMPDSSSSDGVSTQLLLKISNDVTGLVTDVAVIKSQMELLPDHENRIRELRAEVPANLTTRLDALEKQQAQVQGGRDNQARVYSLLAAAGALAAGLLSHVKF